MTDPKNTYTPNKSDFAIAVVCSSNMNRSMEAHAFLSRKGFNVKSYGTGDTVRLPGPTPENPNIYDFGVTYDAIYKDLAAKEKTFYTQIGLLSMIDRNRRIKLCPEKFQNCEERFDVVVTCEERVYDQVLEFFHSKKSVLNQPVHIVNIEIPDNHEDATMGAFLIHDLMAIMAQSPDLEEQIEELVQKFELQRSQNIMFCCMYY